MLTRRKALKMALGMGGAAATMGLAGKAVAQMCSGATPPQTPGPFFPDRTREDENWDLTQVKGRPEPAKGDVVYIVGKVTDQNCKPVSDVYIKIWQASANGRYLHNGDRNNTNPLDDNFQYWGETLTDADGNYMFKTIIPGDYAAGTRADGSQWIRPPHVHCLISKVGYEQLVTQLYFEGNPYNEDDDVRKHYLKTPEDRAKVTKPLLPATNIDSQDPQAQMVNFDIGIVSL